MCTLLKLFRGYQSHLSSGIANDYTPFFHTLYITFVVATDAVANCDKREVGFVKGVASLGSKLDHALSELVVILFLLHGVVESRMAKVFFSVGNKKLLKLTYIKINTSCETTMEETSRSTFTSHLNSPLGNSSKRIYASKSASVSC